MKRNLVLLKNTRVTPCKCGNNTHFTLHAERCDEDLCETWVVCKCGYDPTTKHPGLRYENIWGAMDNDAATVALDCWNTAIKIGDP